ncbi:L-fuconolactonase [Mycetocola sp. BIGb0189]|uniref:amidohydrolase family protein n=1 Tax=Mycetocola sp. BIGb0189 TaxID=2940604 RepID=UPI0021685B3C|nr:amidohydrolase family protein [Mycetocola sp. BIGb0189]MCS4277109.1 L-fuconolactonase [Mycetocola sp. BIGb0189]
MSALIDAHLHVWDRTRARYEWLNDSHAPINRDMPLAEAPLTAAGVSGAILVQAADNPEDTAHMLAVAAADSRILGVVGYVPLHEPDLAAAALDRLSTEPAIVGIRNLTHDRADPDWLVRPEVLAGIALVAERGLPLDIVAALPRHLEHIPVIADRFPDLRIILDHLGTPPVGGDLDAHWHGALADAAARPNVWAKVSGLYPAGRASATVAELEPVLTRALRCFGADRLMLGSDWPINELFGGPAETWRALLALTDTLTLDQRAALRHRTAERAYALTPGKDPHE